LNAILDNTHQGAHTPVFVWPAERASIDRQFIDVGYTHQFTDDWSLSTNFTFNGQDFFFPINQSPTIASFESDGWLFEVNSSLKVSDELSVIVGGTIERVSGVIDLGAANKYHVNRKSMYMQADYVITEWLKLVGGFQLNIPEVTDPKLSPRAGVIANFSDNWGIKLLYGEAFRMAAGGALFLDTPFYIGNKNIEPETIKTTDAQIFYQSPRFNMALTYYQSNAEDIHGRESVAGLIGVTTEVNEGSIESNGIEFESKMRLNESWDFEGSLSYQVNEDYLGRNDAMLSPNLMAKLGVNWKPSPGYHIGLFNSYFGESGQVEKFFPNVDMVNPPANAYDLLTLNVNIDLVETLGWRMFPESSFSLYIDNLLDENIYQPEINTKVVNTLPSYSGIAFYLGFEFKL